ncbi:MAG: FG-GAP repeat domain-containing protein, partial [bacterium]
MRKLIVSALLFFSTTALPQTSAKKLHWRTIDAPTQEDIHYAKRLNESLGYIFIQNRLLFKFEKNEWREMPLPRGVLTDEIYVVGEDNIWAVVQPVDQYRQRIMHFEKGQWRYARTPNIDFVKIIFFESPDSAWAGCNWGEILRFKNGEWRQVRSPTRCHIEKFIKGANGEMFAITDCPSGGGSQVLVWKAGSWEILTNHHSSILNNGLVSETGDLWIWDSEIVYLWDGEKLVENEAHPPIRRVAFYSQGDGYLFTPDSAFYFSSFLEKRKTPVSVVDINNVAGITLADDGSGWLYGFEGKLLGLGEGSQETRPAELRFVPTVRELGKIMGSAVVRIGPDKRDLYIVEHEKPNFIVQNVEQKTDILQPVIPGRMHSLDEPQKNTLNEPNYDFAALAGDFNGDRKEDIFLTSLYGANCLFLNLDEETFINATDWAGPKTPGGRYGIAATADVNNDGDLDLFVPDEMGRSKLYLNDGYARFTDEAALRGALVPYAAKASCFGDIDADGWIDLAVTTYHKGTYLFRNLGQGYFQDISAKSPSLNPAQPENCSSLAFVDYDNDGDLDLFICKMLASNTL